MRERLKRLLAAVLLAGAVVFFTTACGPTCPEGQVAVDTGGTFIPQYAYINNGMQFTGMLYVPNLECIPNGTELPTR